MKKNYSVFENIKFTHKYLLKDYKVKYWLGTIVTILCNILTTFMLVLLPAYTVNLLTGNESIANIIIKFSAYCFVLYTVTILYKRLEKSIDNNVDTLRMEKQIDYYDHIMKTDYINLDTSKNRDLFNAGIDSYMDGPHLGFFYIINDFKILLTSILGLIVYCVFIAKVNVFISLILILISSLSVLVNYWDETWINKNKENWFKIESKIKYLSSESSTLKSAKDIRLYGIKKWFLDTFDYLINLRQNWHKKEQKKYYLVNISERFLTAIKYGIAYFIVYKKVVQGNLDIGQFIMVIGLILGINNWITSIFDSIKYLQLNNVNVNNSRTALEMSDIKPKNAKHNESTVIPSDYTYEIKFENVSFAFPESDKKIFDNFNLTIHKGEKLALVGVNGAGKTTLVKLMCGLYKPTEGRIYLNGKDISQFDKEEYYKLFSIVFQDFHVLAMSIAENISCRVGVKTNYEKVYECIKLAGLEDKVKTLKDGINTNLLKELDNDGVVLSGGESQKLMLARCLYKDSPLIILDEPTSALDAIAESEMYEKYGSLTNSKTSIFISHRLSSTKFCDRVIMLKNGCIIEEGTHDELLKRNGEYAKMFDIQASYYQEEVQNSAC